MKTSFVKIALLMIFAGLLFNSCSEDSEQIEVTGVVDASKSPFGNKEPIPYSLTNMRLALQSMEAKGLSKSGLSIDDIKATHIYVKFIPKDFRELSVLKSDTVLDVVPFPLDYDMEGFDGSYRESGLLPGQPTPYYSVVEVGYVLPAVEYQILDSAFMPDMIHNTQLSKSNRSIMSIWDDLETEAIKISGIESGLSLSKKSRKNPEGYVRNYGSGVEGIKVHVNFSLHRHNTRTDATGHYYFSETFKNQIHHHFFTETDDFAVLFNNESDFYAWYGGRSDPGKACNWDIVHTGHEGVAADIFIEMQKMYKKNYYGLLSPASKSQTGEQMVIHYWDDVKFDLRSGFSYSSKLGPEIAIFPNSSENQENLFGGCAESTYWACCPNSKNYNKDMSRQWGEYVSKYRLGGPEQDYPEKMNNNIFYDLTMSLNYTISQLESCMIKSLTWTELKGNLKESHNYYSERDLDRLFEKYNYR